MRDLSRLFQPASIAVIGGGAWCASVVEQCIKIGFDGPLWPVHPSKDEISGVPTYRDLSALPGVPDAVFIGVNRTLTLQMVRELRDMGAGGAVCFASGFQEAQAEMGDGADLQNALLEAAGEMAIIGPNCYGFVNYLDGALLWPDQHGGERCGRGVAILTQSSNMAINLTMQQRGVPLAYVVTAGNQAQTDLSEIGTALLRDARVTALGLHVEGVRDLAEFEAMAAQAQALGKPIVALKAGKSEQARTAAVSHTASLAGSDAGARALLRRLGIAQVDSLPALLETLKLLHFAGPLEAATVASLSCSGGEASLMADSAEGRGIAFPSLTDAQSQVLRDVLGPMVALANPLDYHTFIWDDTERMAQVFAAMLSGPAQIGCVIVDFPRTDRCDAQAWDCVLQAGARAAAGADTPLALVATLPEALPEEIAQRAIAGGMIPLHGLDDALTAIKAAAFLGCVPGQRAAVLHAGPSQSAGRSRVLDEAQAKVALSGHGLDVPRFETADSPEEAAHVANSLRFPVVLKGSGVAHKTEAGLVTLDLANAQAVLAAAQEMKCRSFLIEEMVPTPIVELLIGVLRDEAHGFVLTLGAGGVLTEVLSDTVSLLLPVTPEDINVALGALRVAPLLHGYRGKPGADISTITAAVLAVQDYVTAHANHVEEVEINPLIVTPTRATAVDALIRTGDTE